MKVITQNGKNVLTAHIFKAHELEEGSQWLSMKGDEVVTLEWVECDRVVYRSNNGASFNQSVFAFQLAYNLIVR